MFKIHSSADFFNRFANNGAFPCRISGAGITDPRGGGIGKRTAERMVLELHDKLEGFGFAPGAGELPAGNLDSINDAALALEQLGFKKDAIRKTLQTLASEMDEKDQTTENLLRAALAKLNF